MESMTDTPHTAEQILNTALSLAETHSWERLHLFQIAAVLEITLEDIHRHYAQKDDLVEAWFDRADRAMLAFASQGALLDLTPHERFKRVMWAWLDALAAHRRVTGDMLLYKLEPAHPHLQIQGLLRISRTVQWMREAIASHTTHLRRITEEVVDTGIYLSTFLYWLRDDSVGFTKTHRFLDRQLARTAHLGQLLRNR